MSEFVQNIADWVLHIAQGNPYVAILLMTAVPVVGLNGAIPLGEILGVGLWATFGLTILGRAVLCMPLLLFWRQIFVLGKKLRISRWLVLKLESVLMSKADRINSLHSQHIVGAIDTRGNGVASIQHTVEYGYLGATGQSMQDKMYVGQRRKFGIIVLLTSLPVPIMGLWTSGVVVAMMGTRFWVGVSALMISNIVNGLSIVLLIYIFGDNVEILLVILTVIAVLFLIILLTRVLLHKEKTAQSNQD
jgi:uncharacterized membrane protein